MRTLAVAALTTAFVVLGLVPVGAAGPGGAGAAPAAAAAGRNPECPGVTIVVDQGDLTGRGLRKGVIQCEPTTGPALDVLRAAGLKLEGTAAMGLAFVCRVEGRPAADEAIAMPDGSTRTESCQRTPPANAYWSLWTAHAGEWTYATAGIGDIQLGDGDAIAFVYAVARDEGLTPFVTVSEARVLDLPNGWEGRVPAGGLDDDGSGPGLAVYAGAGLLVVLVGVAAMLARRRRRPR